MSKINYKEINEAILTGRDINSSLVTKDERFYRYLHNNKVAYYYSKHLSKTPTDYEKWIIRRGEELNDTYNRSLSLLHTICSEENIPFLLYKTHKFIPEVVDGDIDIIVHANDFSRFLEAFRKKDFFCIEDEPGKGKCIKDGYNVIEPHITISWRGNDYVDPEHLWKSSMNVSGVFDYKVIDPVFESSVKCMQVLYEPEYITLYDVIHMRLYPVQSNHQLPKRLYRTYEKSIREIPGKKFPLFLSNNDFVIEWTKELFKQKNIVTYLKHMIFFFYWKYRYQAIDKLPFSHDWSR